MVRAQATVPLSWFVCDFAAKYQILLIVQKHIILPKNEIQTGTATLYLNGICIQFFEKVKYLVAELHAFPRHDSGIKR